MPSPCQARTASSVAPGTRTPRGRDAGEAYGCWLVALAAIDDKQYVYRVYAPADALLGDLFWEAWHCHDEGPFPRASDLFDTALIRRISGSTISDGPSVL